MITKQKKIEIIDESEKELQEAKILLFADFEGAKVEELRHLRQALKNINAKFKVIKKRLLKIALQRRGIEFDPLKFKNQVGAIFTTAGIEDVVPPVYQFSREHASFKLLGGLDIERREEVPFETIQMVGSLPSREILLAQLMGVITAPLRGLMYILSEKSKRS